MSNVSINLWFSIIHLFSESHCFFFLFFFPTAPTVDLISRRKKPDVGKSDPSSVTVIKFHHHATILLLLSCTWSTQERSEPLSVKSQTHCEC